MSVDVRVLDLSNHEVAAKLLALQRASYAAEAEQIDFSDIPPLHESLEVLVAARLAWLGVWDGGELAAAVAWRDEGGVVDVHRLVVHPAWFRRGLASALLAALPGDGRAMVTVAERNAPGRRCYERAGFRAQGDAREVAPGLRMLTYVRGESSAQNITPSST